MLLSLLFYVFLAHFSKDSSAKYDQDNKERLQKKALERCQSLPKWEKE